MSGRIGIVLLIAAGCGGGSSTSAATSTVDPGPDLWSEKSFEDKHARMTFTFHPNMARRFSRFTGSDYPDLACVTCHGMDAEALEYRMPNGLPPLDPDDLPTADDSEMARFMIEVVVPEADRLMQAGGRIDCFSCHPRARGAS